MKETFVGYGWVKQYDAGVVDSRAAQIVNVVVVPRNTY